jgi:membrane-associated protease RseP (regulator of RpoE activity)
MDEQEYLKDFGALDVIVRQIFMVDDITLGTNNDPYLIRYRGRLNQDSIEAYDFLAEKLKVYNMTPLFRWDGDQHAILIVQGVVSPKPSNPKINLILFILTVLSVLITGALYGMSEQLPENLLDAIWPLVLKGLPFAVSMLSILAAHEFGHYLMGRYHKVNVTLPYFIPFPLSPFGTLGAFISMKSIPKNRRHLLDIGVAGPLAGLAVAIPVLLIGLSGSTLDKLPAAAASMPALQLEGNSLLYLFFKWLVFGQWLPSPASYGSLPPILHWISFFFTGMPQPWGGLDVSINSVAWAGWAGLLVTSLNLIPAGQLDGGHVFYVLFGQKTAKKIFPFILAATIVMGFVWTGWWVWTALIFFTGRAYAEPLDQITPLDTKRKIIAIFALIVFILTFIPVPLSQM